MKGARLEGGRVVTPSGWKTAYQQYARGGWIGAATDADIGGMGLPHIVGAALQEMLHRVNMSFAVCPMLSQGAIKTLSMVGSATQKETFLPRTGVGRVDRDNGAHRAAGRFGPGRGPHEGGAARRSLFDSPDRRSSSPDGDHDLTDNIIHLVLARSSAGAGTKGLSLFVVPKFLVGEDGSLGADNDVRCVSIEHKLGIHASPTAFLSFGDNGRCVGDLVGAEGRGLEYMFIMMNEARLGVAVQGVGIAERAYQAARAYGRERIEGRVVGDKVGAKSIQYHPDVHRMLMTMRVKCEAMRGVAYLTARSLDLAHASETEEEHALHEARLGLLVPIAKGWCTEEACEIASIGIQVHGGVGYVEETGAAQQFRDARISTIYEGTTGIQANDLLGRKIMRDNGSAMKRLIADMRATDDLLGARNETVSPCYPRRPGARRQCARNCRRFIAGGRWPRRQEILGRRRQPP